MSTRLHLGRRIRPSTHLRRHSAVLAVAALALGGLVAVTAPAAQAALTAVGPIDAATEFPESYTDANGVTLDMCLDPALVDCLSNDLSSPDGEGFYFDALADIGGITADLALEAAWLSPTEPVVFQRIQYQADAGLLVPGATYTMTTPYGVDSCTAIDGRTRCRFEVGGAAGGDFNGALAGSIGPFLRSVSAPAGMIGDNATPTKVVGSPTGFNKFRIQGPGLPDNQCGVDCAQTDQFIIQGRFLGAAPADVARQAVLPTTALDLGSQPVAGGASAAKSVTVVSNGTAPLTGITAASGSAEFPVTSTCPASLAPGAECTVSVSVDPSATGARGGNLTIASSGGNQVIPLSGFGTAGVMSVGPNAVDFGGAAVGSQRTRIVTVSNTGNAPMTFGSATVTGSQASSFGVGGVASPACVAGASIAAGSSCQIGVTFRPTANGARSAALNVTSSGTSLLVALTGIGTGADSISPKLASRTPGVGAKQVSRSTNVEVRFTEAVRGVSKSTYKLISTTSGKVVKAKIAKVGGKWRLDPARRLAGGTKYRVQLMGGGNAIRDLAGNALANQRWSFTTK